jgi:hypothetical protein
MIIVSRATEPPSPAQLTGLTYATITAEQRRESRRSWDLTDLLGSAVVLFLIAASYVYFSR